MKKPFDPFDESLRDKKKRRRPSVVREERELYARRIDCAFKSAIANCNDDSIITSEMLLMYIFNDCVIDYDTYRMNAKKVMARIGYRVFANASSKDGRWYLQGKWTRVYVKNGVPFPTKKELICDFG